MKLTEQVVTKTHEEDEDILTKQYVSTFLSRRLDARFLG